MMIRGLVCISLLGLAGCAHYPVAQHLAIRDIARQESLPRARVLPPEEYDRPFKGWLTVERSNSQSAIRSRCQPTTFPYHLGCARSAHDICHILIADDETIKKSGWTYEIVLRHEIGHCNGWPGDHRGAR